jgi:hypothetical protein
VVTSALLARQFDGQFFAVPNLLKLVGVVPPVRHLGKAEQNVPLLGLVEPKMFFCSGIKKRASEPLEISVFGIFHKSPL